MCSIDKKQSNGYWNIIESQHFSNTFQSDNDRFLGGKNYSIWHFGCNLDFDVKFFVEMVNWCYGWLAFLSWICAMGQHIS